MASVMPDILTDVEALAVTVGGTWTFSVQERCLAVRVKKKMIVLPEDGRGPLLVIVGKKSKPGDEAFEGWLIREHEVHFALLFANDMNFEDLERMNDKLLDLQKALHVTTLTTATTVYDSDLEAQATFDTKGIPAGWDKSLFKVTYKSSETRN